MHTESEIIQILTISNCAWQAGLQIYDFLHAIKFTNQRKGGMSSGGGQRLALEVNFRYQLLNKGTHIRFEYQNTDRPDWGIRYRTSPKNRVKEVEIDLYGGPFEVEEPYSIRRRYGYMLTFRESPFPLGTESYYQGNLFFLPQRSLEEGRVEFRTPNIDSRFLVFYGHREGN